MAHFAGLVAGGVHPSPVPHAHLVTTTTHKTLRGPRSGLILCRQQFAAAVDQAVFPGQQGGPLVHVMAAKAVAFREALEPDFRQYAQQVVVNAKVLAETLMAEGYRVISGGTDTHVMLIDVFARGILGSEAEFALHEAGITVNKNSIPYDVNPPMKPSGIRIGSPALTTRGMREPEMRIIGKWIAQALDQRNDPQTLRRIRAQVLELVEASRSTAGCAPPRPSRPSMVPGGYRHSRQSATFSGWEDKMRLRVDSSFSASRCSLGMANSYSRASTVFPEP